MTAPTPAMAGLTGEFHRFLAEGELRLQRCMACGTFRHLPRYWCPKCHSDRWEWQVASGTGEIFSWTTTMRPLHPAFTEVPMVLVTVTMAEGPRLLGQLADVAPADVRIGLPVVIDPEVVAEGIGLPRFRPA